MVVYTGYSNAGPLVRLASTRDFVSFERHGTLMPPEDKDAALFSPNLRRSLGSDPQALWASTAGCAHLDLLESRPSQLGQPHDPPPCPRRRLVGRKQDRARPATAPHRPRLAAALSRRPDDPSRFRSTASGSLCSTKTIPSKCSPARANGSSARKRSTKGLAMSSSPADGYSGTTETPSPVLRGRGHNRLRRRSKPKRTPELA